ncbi:MAG: thiamine phosphate synthase [Alphaproteobacteria bacterium]|nr:thiamine phosphate synthase [Alphaproteobacteria bacterium]
MTRIYLISPEKLDIKNFSPRLELALKTGLVPVFQLRLKAYEKNEILKISRELKKICHDNNCLFLLNDSFELALEAGADGVHLGVEDGLISAVRKKSPRNFLIGASCYDSRHLALEAEEQGADYISFGAFFPSKTKISRGKPTTEIITWAKELLNLPIVAIGGITDQNANSLAKAGADFVSVISYVWDHPQGEVVAIDFFKNPPFQTN